MRRGREVRRLRADDGRPLHAPGPGASLEPVAADQISRGIAKRVRLAGGLLDHVSELVREQRAIGRPAPGRNQTCSPLANPRAPAARAASLPVWIRTRPKS